jgi:hypothetical protein
MGRPRLKPPKERPNEMALRHFLTAATTDVGEADHVEPSAHLYAAFTRYCSQENIKRMGASAFGRELGKTMGFEPVRMGAGRQKAWRDIRLRPRWKEIAEQAIERRADDYSNGRFVRPASAPKKIYPLALVSRFLTGCTERDEDSAEPFAALFTVFRWWCSICGYLPLGRKKFGAMLTELRIESGRVGHGRQRVRQGIRLKTGYAATAMSPLAPSR